MDREVAVSRPRVLANEYFTDACFFGLFIAYGLFSGKTRWVPIMAHVTFSSIAGFFVASTTGGTIGFRNAAAIFVGVSCTVTTVVDFLFICGYVTQAREPVDLFVTCSVILVAFASALSRLYDGAAELETEPSNVASGAAIAASVAYLLWLVFKGQFQLSYVKDVLSWESWTSTYYVVFVSVLLLTKCVVFVAKHSLSTKGKKHELFWIISSVFLFLDYLVLLGNISPFLTTVVGGSRGIAFFEHSLDGQRALIEGAVLASLAAIAQSIVLFDSVPTCRTLIGTPELDDSGQKTVAILCISQPAAAAIHVMFNICFASLPLLCSVGALVAENVSALERLVLSAYAVHLSFRYWIKMHTMRYDVFCTFCAIGLTLDLVVLISILIGPVLDKVGLRAPLFNCRPGRTVVLACATSDVQIVFGVVSGMSVITTFAGLLHGIIQSSKSKQK
jgi:hypothetical protein